MRTEGNGLIDLINDLPSDLIMAEIGCYAGESMEMFQSSGKIKKYYAIDIWDVPNAYRNEVLNPIKKENSKLVYENIGKAEKLFNKKIKKYNNIIKLKMDFKTALKKLEPLDFIYIDAEHTYNALMNDISYAKKIIKNGGIIAGHDYSKGFDGIVKAVNESFLNYKIKKYRDSSWLIKL
jgi:SAM-dependent methyltransferase